MVRFSPAPLLSTGADDKCHLNDSTHSPLPRLSLLVEVKVEVLVAQSCPTLFDHRDCSPPGSFVHRNLQEITLEWVAIPFLDLPSPGIKSSLLHCRQILYHLSHQGKKTLFLSVHPIMEVAWFYRGQRLKTQLSGVRGPGFKPWL